jgi:hypothetical protein
MNDMYGIEPAIALNDSRALSGCRDSYATVTQGIVLTHSALGWSLMAFQAIALVAVRNFF